MSSFDELNQAVAESLDAVAERLATITGQNAAFASVIHILIAANENNPTFISAYKGLIENVPEPSDDSDVAKLIRDVQKQTLLAIGPTSLRAAT
ncbi:hypothetical protein [Burkholderia cepacia]|uniref:hypothetical protein n=1 Tax=Burkholderia cepacia TaxID=292 RepID=UPI001CF58339|nr:hypothetical protein [Burkholderia cepacia]MCA8328494.1 hypothetical protein [Burkholderia cepacia]